MSGTWLIVSTTGDLSVAEAWSTEVTLVVERMLAEVSTVQRFFLVFLGAFSLHWFC